MYIPTSLSQNEILSGTMVSSPICSLYTLQSIRRFLYNNLGLNLRRFGYFVLRIAVAIGDFAFYFAITWDEESALGGEGTSISMRILMWVWMWRMDGDYTMNNCSRAT